MAFFRFNRDKRGYENFYLVEPSTNRRGKVKTRILYWFRTPPGVRVGREPFDEGVRKALEAQNPGVTFDWRSIVEAPIPSADAEKWRERRRAERAAKQAVAAADLDDDAAEEREEEATPSDAAPPELAADAGAPPEAAPSAPQAAADPARKRRRRRRGRRPEGPGAQDRGPQAQHGAESPVEAASDAPAPDAEDTAEPGDD